MKLIKIFLSTYFLLITNQAFADSASVYFNGDILTMDGDKPQYVEAVVVKGKKIAYAGNMRDALNEAGSNSY